MTGTRQDALAALPGLPLGTGTAVICDSCNARIARKDAHGIDVLDAGDDFDAHLYLTHSVVGWESRFVTCPGCGPVGTDAAPDEAHVRVTLDYEPATPSHVRGGFVVTDATLNTDVDHAPRAE